MKRVYYGGAWLLVAMLFLSGFGCSRETSRDETLAPRPEDLTTWEYTPDYIEPQSGTSAGEDIVLGDTTENSVAITVPGGAFDDATDVTLVTPTDVPGYVAEDMQMLGAPFEIDSAGEQRINEPLEVSFRVDPAILADAEATAALRMVYYDGKRWDTIKPVTIDKDTGILTFHMYHFSYGGLSQAKKDLIKKHWIQSQALDNYMSQNTDEVSGALAEKAIDLTLAKMGITDESVKGAILSDILKNDAYQEMYASYQKGDVAAFNEKFSVLMGEKIAARVPDSALKGALGSLIDATDDVAAVSQAAGYAAEGQYKEAAKLVGEMIADKFIITTAGKIAVEVIQGQIDGWKNEEIDAAYAAYKNGANNRFWGYNVTAGDFDAVWRQMRGVGRQIELEAIKRENTIRTEAGMPELTEKEMDKVRIMAREATRKQFASRAKGDDKIAYEQEQLDIIMTTFDDAGWFDTYGGPQGFQKGHTLETKMDIINHFTKKMMDDVGLHEFVGTKGPIEQERIRAESVLLGAQMWFSEPDGHQKYKEYIHEQFGVALAPKLSELAGSWSGATMTISDMELSEEARAQLEALGGCEVDGEQVNLDELEGSPLPLELNIQPSSEGAGTLTIGQPGEAKPVPFTYADGIITAHINQDDTVMTVTLPVTVEDGVPKVSGTIDADYKEGMMKVKGTINASR